MVHLLLEKQPCCIGPDSKVYGANMGLSDPDEPHDGPMNLATRGKGWLNAEGSVSI